MIFVSGHRLFQMAYSRGVRLSATIDVASMPHNTTLRQHHVVLALLSRFLPPSTHPDGPLQRQSRTLGGTPATPKVHQHWIVAVARSIRLHHCWIRWAMAGMGFDRADDPASRIVIKKYQSYPKVL